MTERLRSNLYEAHPQGEPRSSSHRFDEGLGTKKTMLVLVVVVGCFAVLWPKLFYPMLVNNANNQMKPGPVDKTTGCCDVISELDLDTIKIMSELCSTIIDTSGETPPSPKEIVTQCRKAVLETCGIDISAVLQDRIISLGHSVKQILEEVRSLNGSLCLKYNFGLSPWSLGVPHRVNINLDPINNIRQERPSHLRPEMVHPAFKERGRAIPQPDASGLPRRSSATPRIVEGRPGPIPGMRPAMGGPGHVVAPTKQSNYGFMGVLMPIYTVGFVVFFTYTIMKLVFKKKPDVYAGAPLYPPCERDEQFHKDVFEANKTYFHRPNRDNSKIGDEELDQLRKRLRETELAMERIVEQMTQAPLVTQDEIRANGSLPKEDEQGTVTVMGMETTASSEGGKKWSRPDSPVLPHPRPVAPKEPSPPPQQIFLEGSLPPQSQILVADSATEAQKDPEDDSPVVLAGKMTLSVISLDSETGTEDSSNAGKKAETSDEERRTSSSNVSEEFEKINAADLEDQINNIITEAENIALTEENRYSLGEELDTFTEEIHKAPQINEKDQENDVLEEIKNQLNLEDDLLLALKSKEPEGKVSLPVTDIIKEFLSSEENALLEENQEIGIRDLSKEALDILEEDKLSPSAERHDQELKIDDGLKEDTEIVNLINEEIETLGTEKDNLEHFEKEQQGLVAEDLTHLNLISDKSEEENISGSDDAVNVENNQPGVYGGEELGCEKELQNLVDETIHKEDLCILQEDANLGFSVGDHHNLLTLGQENTNLVSSINDQQDLVTINQENAIMASSINDQQVTIDQENTNFLSSVNHHQDLVNKEKEESSSDQEYRNRRGASQESNGSNKAELLLQGLMVREDDELLDQNWQTAEVVESEKSLHKDDSDFDKQDLSVDAKEGTSALPEVKQLIQEEISSQINRPTGEHSRGEEISGQNVVAEDLNREENFRLMETEEELIDDADYDDDSEIDALVDDEVRDINRDIYQHRGDSIERRINGENVDSSRNGTTNSETAAENEISEDEDLDNEDDDEEIEEIIEYVDNTDEEGEEVIEINGNEHRHLNENDEN